VPVISTRTNTVVATITGFTDPAGIAADANRAYVDDESADAVAVIDIATNSIIATIPVSAEPSWITINPQGTRAYVPAARGAR
jgi:YVTN family beta-propeller protein